jgi:hypothetical protein
MIAALRRVVWSAVAAAALAAGSVATAVLVDGKPEVPATLALSSVTFSILSIREK